MSDKPSVQKPSVPKPSVVAPSSPKPAVPTVDKPTDRFLGEEGDFQVIVGKEAIRKARRAYAAKRMLELMAWNQDKD